MFFFQDDIGLLIQHATYDFWRFLFLPQAEHFAPVLHALTFLEYQLFVLNFYGYFFVSLFFHFINLFLLYRILKMLQLPEKLSLAVSMLFFINLTFVEPLLWFSAQGVILANIFIALSFFFWLKKSLLLYIFLLAASFSYSTGVGLGIIFGLIGLIYKKFIPAYFILGILSILVGPLVATSSLGQITPQFPNRLLNTLQFLAFVIGGVGRGVFGRLFLPGFEPRHFEIAKTLLSFLPFAAISALVFSLQKSSANKFRQLLFSLSLLIVYPYIWAGAIRYQFGIKQALSERYAYPSLYFTVILIGVILNYFFAKKILSFYKIIIALISILLIFQTFNFYIKAVEFEKRPLLTKKYFSDLKKKLEKNDTVPDLPLPSYINQPLTVSDLLPLISP